MKGAGVLFLVTCHAGDQGKYLPGPIYHIVITYNKNDQIKSYTNLNGTVLMKSIFDDGRRPGLITYKSGGNTLFERAMTWNLTDMKLSETGPGIGKEYTYDTACRLKKEINKRDKYIGNISEFAVDDDDHLEQIF